MHSILHYEFMRNALAAGVLASIACGIVGSFVVVNKLSSLSGGIAHAAYGGLGLAALLRWQPLFGAVCFSTAASLLMGYISEKNRERADAAVGVIWAVGMASGILMIDFSAGYYVDLMSFLFGSILAVTGENLVFMLTLDIVIALTVGLFFKEFLGMSYDEEFAKISGVPVRLLYYVMLVLVALAVVMLIRVVGLILVIALFTIPAAIAEMITISLKRMMLIAAALGIVFTSAGLFISYFFNLTSGATIIMTAGIAYAIAALVKTLVSRKNNARKKIFSA